MNIKWIGANSNNYTAGRSGKTINKIVLHWIVGTLESADATFANPDRKASAHYGIGDEEIHQWVKEEDTAWGASNWDVNQTCINIEHEGGWLLPDGTRQKPSDATHKTSAELVADICRRYNLPIDRNTIHVHNEYSTTTCPGTLDVNRIIELAKGFSTTVPDPVLISDPKTKLNLGSDWGIRELQATISALNDQKRDLDNANKQIEELKTQKLASESALLTEISENDRKWQLQLDSANTKLGICETRRAENLTYSELFSIAWKKFWSIRKQG